MKVTKGSLVKLRGTLRHGLYVLEGTTVSGSAAIASGKVIDMSMLWHRRLAHVSERGLQALSQQGLLGGVNNVELPFCEHCIMGKSTRVRFGKGKHTTKGILDYVHSDLWGPTKEARMGGRKVKYLRIDNGLEFVNNKFNNFCKSEEITKHFTVTYTTQQNGLAERFNRTIMERTRSPSTSLNLKTPQKVWTGKAPSLDHLRVFGCTAYAHVKDGKLNKMALKCMFIGDHVVTKVRIASEVRPSVGLDVSSDQPSLVSEIEDTQQSEFDADSIEAEPFTFEEAIVYDSKKQWKDAMEVELFSLHKNQTWSLVPKPPNQKLIQSKWIYKIKLGTGGNSKPRYKARLVAKGYTQKEGVDFHEIFSTVVRHSSIRLILSIAVHFDMFIEQMDVTTTFLHGELEEVYRLHKSLYGLKQSPRQWYIRFDTFILKQGFHRNSYDACVYWKLSQKDDMILVSKDYAEICELKKQLSNEFEMKDLGELKRILGIDVKRDRKKSLLTILQESYVIKLLTKPNLGYAMSIISRDRDKSTLLEGFTDADYAADLDKRRSLSSHIFRLYDNVVSWKVNLQPVVALLTTESEYISLGEAVKEAVWLKRIVGELLSQKFIPIIHCESQSAIHLAKNPSHHERSKHIDIKFYYIRNIIAQKDVEMVKVHKVENLSDMLTKALSAHRFKYLLDELNVKSG
ncbi:hypothetical protein E5676_scaffold367G00140 [Cucumis melo var. makuwa]|uniref:Integrase catalytic domain-containing protein n=1 Tax=Cucumis melo var. makuwa TaxID=1194695 RepID=A0A5D3CJG1_CUCMM|nr:hypothetical protein E5676_scaffold367G00140 [Cucumis melo var. makuwa]